MKKVRTRFAPSPTGRMHVGNLRTALYAYLIAKHEGGDFMLRIEDTDQERYVEGALDIIYRTLEKTGLVHDEGPDKDGGVGPYVQSERQASGIYMKYAKQLIEQGDAYYCFCDKERLESLKSKVSDEDGGTEIVVYDKHCLHLSKEEIEANLAAGTRLLEIINMPLLIAAWITPLKQWHLKEIRLHCVLFHLLSIIKLTVLRLSFRLGDTLYFLLLDFYS